MKKNIAMMTVTAILVMLCADASAYGRGHRVCHYSRHHGKVCHWVHGHG